MQLRFSNRLSRRVDRDLLQEDRQPGSDDIVNNSSETLFVNVQHWGGDGRDLAVAITYKGFDRRNRV